MGGGDRFRIRIKGKGGDGGEGDKRKEGVVMGWEMVSWVEEIVRGRVDGSEGGVIWRG